MREREREGERGRRERAILVSNLKPCIRDNVNVYPLATPLSRLITIIDPTQNTSTNKTFSNWPHTCSLHAAGPRLHIQRDIFVPCFTDSDCLSQSSPHLPKAGTMLVFFFTRNTSRALQHTFTTTPIRSGIVCSSSVGEVFHICGAVTDIQTYTLDCMHPRNAFIVVLELFCTHTST